MTSFQPDQMVHGMGFWMLGRSHQMTEAVKTSDRLRTPCADRENWEFESARCRYDLIDTGSSSLHRNAN
jgi:hypothetical protein